MKKKRKKAEPTQPAPKPRSRRLIAICLVATAALAAADLSSKSWAESALSNERLGEPPPVCEADQDGYVTTQRARGEPLVLIDGYLEFRYAENCNAAFGLLSFIPHTVRRGLFAVAAVIAAMVLLWMFARGHGGKLFVYSVPLIVSGAVGNLADRARLGYVVDFVRFHWQDAWDYPTFNIADIGITVGVVLLVIDGFVQERLERARARAEDGSAKAPGG